MQCASSITSSPTRSDSSGRTSARNWRLLSRSGGDQQQVDAAGGQLRLDRPPLVQVGGVDGGGADADGLGLGDLVAHQRQQRRHQQGWARPAVAQQPGGQEVDRRLPPAGALDHHHPAAVDDQGLDGGQLVVPQRRPRAGQGGQQRLRAVGKRGARPTPQGVLGGQHGRHGLSCDPDRTQLVACGAASIRTARDSSAGSGPLGRCKVDRPALAQWERAGGGSVRCCLCGPRGTTVRCAAQPPR
jgi:hypothetical protein